jgi:hypothetical protein
MAYVFSDKSCVSDKMEEKYLLISPKKSQKENNTKNYFLVPKKEQFF